MFVREVYYDSASNQQVTKEKELLWHSCTLDDARKLGPEFTGLISDPIVPFLKCIDAGQEVSLYNIGPGGKQNFYFELTQCQGDHCYKGEKLAERRKNINAFFFT